MPKLIEQKVARFIECTDHDGNPARDWTQNYLQTPGLLCIYESMKKYPGKKFIYFYPNEPDSDEQRYFHSSCGDLTQEGNRICLTGDHTFVFEEGDFVPEIELLEIKLNVFH